MIRLKSGQLRLYRANLDHWSIPESLLRRTLDPSERLRADAIANPQQRQRYATSRYLLRSCLAALCNTPPSDLGIELLTHGKPRLREPHASFGFNIAHTGADWLLGVIADTMIGVDLERARHLPDMQRLAKRVFTDREQAELAQHRELSLQQHAFFRGWTRKEAVLKALGTGFSQSARLLQVGLQSGPRSDCDCPDGSRLQVRSGITSEGLFWAVATMATASDLQEITLSPDSGSGTRARFG